jgi:hypothetical protein
MSKYGSALVADDGSLVQTSAEMDVHRPDRCHGYIDGGAQVCDRTPEFRCRYCKLWLCNHCRSNRKDPCGIGPSGRHSS